MTTERVKCEKSRILGNTGITLSPLGFGCAAAWGKAVAGKEMISDAEAQKLLERAYEKGVRYFDTGHNYGFSEERLGRILERSKVIKRENIVISTKFGEELVGGKWRMNWSSKWMKESVRQSLSKMKLNYVDMLMCHGGGIDDFSDELLSELFELKKQGIIKAVGINTFDTDVIEWVRDTGKFDFVMLDYNIMRQDREAIIKELYDRGIGVIAGASLAQSLYSKRVYRIRKLKDIWYLARAIVNFREQMIKGRQYRFINKVDGMTGSQVALRYVLDNPYISSAVFGTTTMSHLDENMDSRYIEIPQAIIDKIKDAK